MLNILLTRETEIKTTMKHHFMPARMGMAAFRKQQVTSVGEPLERLCPWTLLVVMRNGSVTAGERFLQELPTELPCAPAISLLLNTHTYTPPPPKRTRTSTQNACIHTHIYTTKRYETTQMSIKGWMDKQTVVPTHSRTLFSHKKNKELINVTTWMNLENTVLSEGSQMLKLTHAPLQSG